MYVARQVAREARAKVKGANKKQQSQRLEDALV